MKHEEEKRCFDDYEIKREKSRSSSMYMYLCFIFKIDN
jgi:hypothetical protein